MKYYSAIKISEILAFVTAWMNLDGIMVSKITQSEPEKIPYDFTYMLYPKNKQNRKTQI